MVLKTIDVSEYTNLISTVRQLQLTVIEKLKNGVVTLIPFVNHHQIIHLLRIYAHLSTILTRANKIFLQIVEEILLVCRALMV